MVEDDTREYRLAFIEAFRKRGIYPAGIKHLSVESLCYPIPDTKDLQQIFDALVGFLRDYRNEIIYKTAREGIFETTRDYIIGRYRTKKKIYGLHRRLAGKFKDNTGFEILSGLMFSKGCEALGIKISNTYHEKGWPSYWVDSLHLASRVGPNNNQNNQIIVSLTQQSNIMKATDIDKIIKIKPDDKKKPFTFSGGCTLIFDLDTLTLKYAISKPLLDTEALDKRIHQLNRDRCRMVYQYQHGSMNDQNQFQKYFGTDRQNSFNEPFHFLHTPNK